MRDCYVSFDPRPAASVTLICIPWVGAGAAPFHAWSAALAPSIELVAVRRAGRERRLRETPMDRVEDVVAELADGLAGDDSRSIVLFGHCVGAMIAFELARKLTQGGSERVRRLIVLGSPGPSAWEQPQGAGDLTAQLRQQGLTDESLMANSRVFDMLRPGIEADLRLGHLYGYQQGAPLNMPITLLAPDTDQDQWLPGWAQETTVKAIGRDLPAGDPYPTGSWLDLAAVVGEEAQS